MNAWKRARRYLPTLPLLNLLLFLRTQVLADVPETFADPAIFLLLLPGGMFLAGMAAGAFWGGLPGLRRRSVAAYTLLSALLCPLPYFLRGEPEAFWLALVLLGGQQSLGFLAGVWCRVGLRRDQKRISARERGADRAA